MEGKKKESKGRREGGKVMFFFLFFLEVGRWKIGYLCMIFEYIAIGPTTNNQSNKRAPL